MSPIEKKLLKDIEQAALNIDIHLDKRHVFENLQVILPSAGQ